MGVARLDHLNLMAADVGATVRFYEHVLGMEGRPPPGATDMARSAWIYAGGAPVIHVAAEAAMRGFGSMGDGAMEGTGRVHHLALECDDYASVRARIDASGCPMRTNEVPAVGLRQLFVRDPNGLLVELNFREIAAGG